MGKKILAYFEITFAVFIWATIELVMHLFQEPTSGLIILFFRFMFGGIFLLAIVIFTKRHRNLMLLIKRYPSYYIPAALIGLTLGMWLFSEGTLRTQPAIAATIISTNPIFISLYMMFFQGEKKSWAKILGIFLGFMGIILILTEGHFTLFFENEYLIGNLMVLAGTVFWVINLIIGKLLLSKIIPSSQNEMELEEKLNISSLEFNTVTFLITGFILIPLILRPAQLNLIISYNFDTWIKLFYLGIFPTGIAYFFYFRGIKSLPASKGANLFYLKPIFSTILAYIILDYIPSNIFYIGIGIEIIALLLITYKPRIYQTKKEEEEISSEEG